MNYKTQKHDLLIKKMKMDKFFSMYIDKFDKKMDPANPNTAIWKLFKQKSIEYSTLCQDIRNTEYWIKKYV